MFYRASVWQASGCQMNATTSDQDSVTRTTLLVAIASYTFPERDTAPPVHLKNDENI